MNKNYAIVTFIAIIMTAGLLLGGTTNLAEAQTMPTYCDKKTVQQLVDSKDYHLINRTSDTTGATINGTEKADLILTSDLGVTVHGRGGNDCIIGGEGSDTLYGDSGVNTIYGRGGGDLLIGGHEADYIFGGDGNDELDGHGGDDTMNGNDGDDIIDGFTGNDTIFGANGRDTINGGDGDDTLNGGTNGDTINGGDGDDTINGGNGNDKIRGEGGNDTLNGGSSNDKIFGHDGNDVINGGAGKDELNGGPGDDTIHGNGGPDTINGGPDNDTIHGEDGNDTISGNNGNDLLIGGLGDDTFDDTKGTNVVYQDYAERLPVIYAPDDVVFDSLDEVDASKIGTAIAPGARITVTGDAPETLAAGPNIITWTATGPDGSSSVDTQIVLVPHDDGMPVIGLTLAKPWVTDYHIGDTVHVRYITDKANATVGFKVGPNATHQKSISTTGKMSDVTNNTGTFGFHNNDRIIGADVYLSGFVYADDGIWKQKIPSNSVKYRVLPPSFDGMEINVRLDKIDKDTNELPVFYEVVHPHRGYLNPAQVHACLEDFCVDHDDKDDNGRYHHPYNAYVGEFYFPLDGNNSTANVTVSYVLDDGTVVSSDPVSFDPGTVASSDLGIVAEDANILSLQSVIESTYCKEDLTIPELIASGKYNVIDERDGSDTKIGGTAADDLILVHDNGAEVKGKNGNDCIIGGAGSDTIKGQKGNDAIYGGDGADDLRGNLGDDILVGDAKDARIAGGQGSDTCTDTPNTKKNCEKLN